MIKIREAKLKDLKSIQKLALLLFEKEYKEWDKTLDLKWAFGEKGTKYFKKRIENENSYVLVATENNNMVGCRIGTISKPEEFRIQSKYAEAELMFVLPEFRSKGIGTKMLNQFIGWCKEKGVKRIKLITHAKNKEAHKLDRKMGFEDYDLVFEKEI